MGFFDLPKGIAGAGKRSGGWRVTRKVGVLPETASKTGHLRGKHGLGAFLGDVEQLEGGRVRLPMADSKFKIQDRTPNPKSRFKIQNSRFRNPNPESLTPRVDSRFKIQEARS